MSIIIARFCGQFRIKNFTILIRKICWIKKENLIIIKKNKNRSQKNKIEVITIIDNDKSISKFSNIVIGSLA